MTLVSEFVVHGCVDAVNAVFPKTDVNQALLLLTEEDGTLVLLGYGQ